MARRFCSISLDSFSRRLIKSKSKSSPNGLSDAAQKKSTSELDEAVVKECGGPTGAGGMTVLGVTEVPGLCIPDKALRF